MSVVPPCGGWWTDSRYRIEDLRGEPDDTSGRRPGNRLRSDLARTTESPEQRIDRLAAAFTAFDEPGRPRGSLDLVDAQGIRRVTARVHETVPRRWRRSPPRSRTRAPGQATAARDAAALRALLA